MSVFIESLQRLYHMKKITKEKLDSLLATNKITKAEYEYIVSVKEVM
jgi:hypothetical protein